MDEQIAKRSISFILYGGQSEYESYMVLKDWMLFNKELQSPPEFHSFTVQQRLDFNEKQLNGLKEFVRGEGGVQSARQSLVHMYNLFGAEVGRPLQVHGFFMSLLKELFPLEKQMHSDCDRLNHMGSILLSEYDFPQKQRIVEPQTVLKNGMLSTPPNIGKSGLYFGGTQSDVALVLCSDNKNKQYMALMRLRTTDGQLCPGVTLKWLGKSLQLTCNWSIHFQDAQVIDVAEWNEQLMGQMLLQDARNQMSDILRLTHLAAYYCTMRKQFRTRDDQSERPIIQYEITTQRIINALSYGVNTMVALNSLKQNYITTWDKYLFLRNFTNCCIQRGAELIEVLREAMGGYGYLRFSGAPTIQERAMWLFQQYTFDADRYAHQLVKLFGDFDRNQVFINSVIGMALTKSPQSTLEEIGELNDQTIKNPFKMQVYYAAKARIGLDEMKQNIHIQEVSLAAHSLAKLYTGIQVFNLCAFRRYRQSNYILDRISLYSSLMDSLEYESNNNNRALINQQLSVLHQDLSKYIILTLDALELGGTFSDSIVGQDNEQQFYENLLDYAKNRNHRNDPEVKTRITQELRTFLQQPTL